VKLIYYEKFPRIDQAFYREKQVQGWCRKKKEALINGCPELLPQLAVAYRDRDGGFECLNHRQVIDVVSEALEDTTSEALEDTTSETMQQ